jgi:iron complex transport system ATP-binding protein
MNLLATKKLSVQIGDKFICEDLNLNIALGECWGLLGLNGIGKTTLLHALAGLRPVAQGEIFLNGTELKQLSKKEVALVRGMLFQNNQDYFASSVLESALIGRHPYLKQWQWENDADKNIAIKALEDVGLNGMEQRFTHQLSAGERQRAAVATLLTQDPQLYFLDEPTNHLDPHHQIGILDLLSRNVKEKNKTIVMALHDINLATRYCDHLILMYGKDQIIHGPADLVLTQANVEKLYRRKVLYTTLEEKKIFYFI